ncbi:hypothetical protein Clacol_006485 [Clathrus columnatus]|uniref:tRNA-intron lyase n=1 Tax=Clathrus columnatus TaxID=1419009 RepID=A0AAV5AGF5_9AGAM|nr:hypothetical protein Clacol_006485 [Clathrus columnatus]
MSHLKIPLYISNENAYVWTAQDVSTLRAQHRICGTLVGTLPHLAQQNFFLGLPLLLMPEEVVLLVEKVGICTLVDDTHSIREPTHAELEEWNEDRKKDIQIQVEQWKEKEKNRVSSALTDRKTKEGTGDVAKRQARQVPKETSEGQQFTMPSTIATYTITIPSMSSTLAWYQPKRYEELAYAREAGIWTYPRTPYERASCRIFRDIWEKRYYLGSGIKFGGEYLIYPGWVIAKQFFEPHGIGDPLRYHSHFVTSISPSPDALIRPMEIVAHGRLATGTKKTQLFCSWKEDDDSVLYYSVDWAGFGYEMASKADFLSSSQSYHQAYPKFISLPETLKLHLSFMIRGVWDACRWDVTFKTIHSIYVFDYLLLPLVKGGTSHFYINWFYRILWLFPLAAGSLYLNGNWAELVARRCFTLQHGMRAVYTPPTYRGFAWIAEGLTMAQRVNIVEERWAYFFAFGLLTAVPCSLLPGLGGTVLFALLLPSFIIKATHAVPVPKHPYSPLINTSQPQSTQTESIYPSPFIPIRLPIFTPVLTIDNFIVASMAFEDEAQCPDSVEAFSLVIEDITKSISNVRELVQGCLNDSLDSKDGISLLSLKHNVLLSYIHTLTLLSTYRVLGHSLKTRTKPEGVFTDPGRKARGSNAGDLIDVLIEDRIVLEKIKQLELKMRYQIQKIVKLAADEEVDAVNDPLIFRPNPNELGENTEGSSVEDFSNEQKKEPGRGVYQPPKLAPVPYTGGGSSKSKKWLPLPAGLAALHDHDGDGTNPHAESTSGLGSMPTFTSSRARELARIREYEEENMTRLIMTKKEARRRARDEEDIALGGAGVPKGRRRGGLADEFNDIFRSIDQRPAKDADAYEVLRDKARKKDAFTRSRTREADDDSDRRPKKKGKFQVAVKSLARKKRRNQS